jgi:ABC-type glycerol-3-phosphate transport system permease component
MRRLLVAVAVGLPLYLAVVASLSPEARLALWPAALTGEHYLALFSERGFWQPLGTSLIVAASTTLLCVSLGAGCAYALARLRFRGRHLVLAVLLAVGMFPQIALVSPLFLLLRAAGLTNTYPGLILPYVTFAMPLAVYLLVGAFRGLPRDLEDAALCDGASRLRVLGEIVLPLTWPALATTAVLTFIYCWNEFLFALSFTTGPERHTVPVAVALLSGRHEVAWGQVLAATCVGSLPVAVLVVAFQRRITSGLTAGAVK